MTKREEKNDGKFQAQKNSEMYFFYYGINVVPKAHSGGEYITHLFVRLSFYSM